METKVRLKKMPLTYLNTLANFYETLTKKSNYYFKPTKMSTCQKN